MYTMKRRWFWPFLWMPLTRTLAPARFLAAWLIILLWWTRWRVPLILPVLLHGVFWLPGLPVLSLFLPFVDSIGELCAIQFRTLFRLVIVYHTLCRLQNQFHRL